MHCDRCNVDFPEGLRYCKWCGEALVDRPRVTSELHSCPSCSAAIQPGWTFCKSCGERLHSVAREAGGAACPRCGAEAEAGAQKCLVCGEDLTVERDGKIAPDSADTSVMTACSSCGERLDTGSLYCKGCGSAVYTEKTPFGGSALLCGACNSFSPLGSRVCRVCGVPLAQGSRTVVDFPAAATTVQRKAPTLPDLDERITEQSPLAKPEQEPMIESGANTLTFTGTEPQTGTALPRGAAETNMLPGTAGARLEQQAPTSIMQMGRITGPVDTDEVQETSNTSGGLTNASATGIDVQPPAIHGQREVASEPTVEFAAGSQPPGPTTLGLGSESESDSALAGSETKTAVFVSRPHEAPPSAREPLPRDDIGTKPFTPVQPTPAPEPTREFQQPARRVTADHVATAGQMTSAPQWTSAEPIGPTPIAEQSEAQIWPDAQGASQPLPAKRTGVVIASVIVVLILLGAAGYVGWLLFGRARPAPVTPPVVVVTPEPPVIPEKPPAPVVPDGMVAVKLGAYTIGRDGADPLEQPEHKVDLRAFFIDRSEVTNAAYKNFVDTTGHKAPSNWSGTSFPEGRAGFPVTGVTWQDAADYAAWSGKRLPTEVEWEAAARGTDGRLYPWGNDWRLGVANIGLKPDKPTPEQYPTGIREVGRYPQGASPAGAVDMIGNAWEWVADEIKVYPGNTESKLDLESGVTYRVIRGGAYDGGKDNDATYRGYQDGSQPYPKVGFRCAKDAK